MQKKIPHYVLHGCTLLKEHGFQAYVVGGAVRDSLLQLEPLDWDLATDATPCQIEEIFPKTIATGRKFGTVTTIIAGHNLEITTLRQDGVYSDGRHPDQVYFTDDLLQDLSRRDFTINALAYDPFTEKLIDPFKGARDLKRKRLVTVGDPTKRFAEDPLRMLRLIRFQATLGFKVEQKTKLAITAPWLKTISPERVQGEFSKMLVGKELGPALLLLHSSGLMKELIPDLAACAGVSAGENHPHDLLGHSILAAHFAQPSLNLRWAALLHDLGKLHSLQREHALLGASMAKEILSKLRYDHKLISEVEILISEHMFDLQPNSSDRAFRRFIAKVGIERARQLVKLRQADQAGLNVNPALIVAYGTAMEHRLTEISAQDNAFKIKDLAINGTTLMAELNLTPSPLVGQLLAYLLDQVLEDPALNNEQTLVGLAKNHLELKQ